METLRKRVPFKDTDTQEGDDGRVMDEEEQEAVIEDIKSANAEVREKHKLALTTILCLSVMLQIISLFGNPLLNVFPHDAPFNDIPTPFIFTIISLGIHLNLGLVGLKEDLVMGKTFEPKYAQPWSYQIVYALASVAPVLALLLRKALPCVLWWSITPLIVFIAQTIVASSKEGMQSITELETLKYRAYGA